MKKTIALLLALCMVLSVSFAVAEETLALKDARRYVKLMYKDKPTSTPQDYELIGSVPTDGEPLLIEWTTDADSIVITREDSGLVKIDVNENSAKELAYTLTATIKDADGNETSISFDRLVPASLSLDSMTEEEIVAAAYTLEDQAKLPAFTALCGDIVAIPSPYSEDYGNITVNIQVGDLTDQPIQCYRLKGEGAADLKEGDHIAVFGLIKNYKGTIEFDAGCVLIPEASCESARVAGFAYLLEDGAAMTHESTITGVITAIPSAYSEDYGNITVNIDVPGLEGYTVQCYRLTGEGAATLAEGDTITVTGTLKNYKGTIEFDKGCVIDAVVKAAAEEEAPAPEEEAPTAEEEAPAPEEEAPTAEEEAPTAEEEAPAPEEEAPTAEEEAPAPEEEAPAPEEEVPAPEEEAPTAEEEAPAPEEEAPTAEEEAPAPEEEAPTAEEEASAAEEEAPADEEEPTQEEKKGVTIIHAPIENIKFGK